MEQLVTGQFRPLDIGQLTPQLRPSQFRLLPIQTPSILTPPPQTLSTQTLQLKNSKYNPLPNQNPSIQTPPDSEPLNSDPSTSDPLNSDPPTQKLQIQPSPKSEPLNSDPSRFRPSPTQTPKIKPSLFRPPLYLESYWFRTFYVCVCHSKYAIRKCTAYINKLSLINN